MEALVHTLMSPSIAITGHPVVRWMASGIYLSDQCHLVEGGCCLLQRCSFLPHSFHLLLFRAGLVFLRAGVIVLIDINVFAL